MSRVYRALEKAEEEKGEKGKPETPLKIFREEEVPKRKERGVSFLEEKSERLERPRNEELSVLIPPTNTYAAEEFRKLKTQVFMRFPNPPCTLLVTSAAPQEGKTTVSVNLACAISKEFHKKAILIDADLRNPSIHPGNGPNEKGLSDYLAGKISLEEILQQSETEKLSLVLAGLPTSQSTELIGSKRMGELLRALHKLESEAYIVVDTSPIMATSEAIMLSKMVDGVILVIMAGRTPKELIKRAFRSIDPQKVVGIVFNKIEMKQSAYYSNYYYRYYRKGEST